MAEREKRMLRDDEQRKRQGAKCKVARGQKKNAR